MEKPTVADTIRNISKEHLANGSGTLLGQCLTAVGYVNNTVPDCDGIIELPMSDVAAAGFAVGLALVGRRPIFVVRFQDLLMLNGSPLIYYAAKSKELHGMPSPIFIRALGSDRIGPVHSDVIHSVFAHFPGIVVASPMTPKEYEYVWKYYMEHDVPVFVSEHRDSFSNTEELPDITASDDADIAIYAVSATRLEAAKAVEKLSSLGVKCNLSNIVFIKPLQLDHTHLNKSRCALVLDTDYSYCGVATSIAYQLISETGKPVDILAIDDASKCQRPDLMNRYPDKDAIVEKVLMMLGRE